MYICSFYIYTVDRSWGSAVSLPCCFSSFSSSSFSSKLCSSSKTSNRP